MLTLRYTQAAPVPWDRLRFRSSGLKLISEFYFLGTGSSSSVPTLLFWFHFLGTGSGSSELTLHTGSSSLGQAQVAHSSHCSLVSNSFPSENKYFFLLQYLIAIENK